GLIGEELRFCRNLKTQLQAKKKTTKLLDSDDHAIEVKSEKTNSLLPRSEDLIEQAISLLSSGDIRCSKKALADKLTLNAEDTDQLFTSLLAKGLVTQKPNRHFVWKGKAIQTLGKAA
ncbi:MAG: Preprotein translocase subunit SecY, partial [Psychromonas sp.]